MPSTNTSGRWIPKDRPVETPENADKSQRPGTDRSVAEWVRKNALTHCPGQDLQAAFFAFSMISLLPAKRPFFLFGKLAHLSRHPIQNPESESEFSRRRVNGKPYDLQQFLRAGSTT
jgi:hypothetical protein